MTLHPTVAAVTDRIIERSRPGRTAYLELIAREAEHGLDREALSCGNLAHGFAASEGDKPSIRDRRGPNLGIVTAYNDMLSAHQPYGRYPEQIKIFAREAGATAQVAGGVPAMCDGVTQGQVSMELSLFSRDTIALSTAVALSHGMFEGAALLGICDKIVPGLLIGALRFGHLPAILIPAGPMPSGLPNKEKQRVRQLFAEGKVGRAELLDAEAASYHSPGTCTFYGTANSNQMMMEMMGLHVPGAAFVNPGTKLRQELTRAAIHRLAAIGRGGNDYRPLGELVDERSIVNAAVGLLATGGSTNHAIPPARHRARRRHRHRLGGHRPPVRRGAADRPHLSERVWRRERLPGGGRHGVHHPNPARRRAAARRHPYRRGREPRRLCTRTGAGRRPIDVARRRRRDARPRHAAPRQRPVPARRRHAAGPGQPRPRHLQDQRRRPRALDDRGAGARLRRPERGGDRIQGG